MTRFCGTLAPWLAGERMEQSVIARRSARLRAERRGNLQIPAVRRDGPDHSRLSGRIEKRDV